MFEKLSTKILVLLTAAGLLTASFFFGFGVGASRPREDSSLELL